MTQAASRRFERGPDARAAVVSRRLTAFGVSLAVSMLALGTLVIVDGRRDAWHQAEQAANNLARALEHDIDRNITILDSAMQGVGERLSEPGFDQASPGVRRHVLFDRAAGAEGVGAILIMDRDGNVVEDSTSPSAPRGNRSSREQFTVHRDRPDFGLYVSPSYTSQVSAGDLRISLSRRLSTRDGAFDGVVEGALRLDYFRHLFEHLDVGAKGSITLCGTDGRIVFRAIGAVGVVSGTPIFDRISAAPSGQFVSSAPIDGV